MHLLLLLLSFLLSQHHDHDGHNHKSFNVGSLKGELVNSSDNSPIAYATIKLFKTDSVHHHKNHNHSDEEHNHKDSSNKLIDGTISQEDGYFIIKDLNPGKYNIQIEHVMYETFLLENQLLVPPSINKNLGILALTQKIVEVDDVSVVDEKPFIEEDIDKKVYNVEDLAITSSGTAEDVLSNLPSITVNTDGEVSLRGNQSVNIMIDGRMKSANNLDILDAAMIEKVEVITIPSSKYDPDGTAGIINIITKRNEYTGTSGKTTLGFDSFGSKTFSINANYLRDKLNLFTNYTNSDRNSEGYSKRYREILDNLDGYNIKEGYDRRSFFEQNNINQNFKFGLEFYPTDNRTFFCDLNYSDYNKFSFETMYNTDIELDLFLPEDTTNTDNNHDGYNRGLMAGYSIILDEGREISFETDSEFDWHATSQVIINNNNEVINTSDSENHDGYNFKVDYIHPFDSNVPDKKNLIEFGLLDKQHGHGTFFSYDKESIDAEYNFRYARNILASYVDVSYYINSNLGLKFGTRFEKSTRSYISNSVQISNDNSDFYLFMINQNVLEDVYEKSYSTIYPSLFFNYNLKERGNIKFGFGRRVERPGDWSLAPVPHNFAEEDQLRIGNPTLNPEDIFKYEVSYSNRMKFGFLTTSLFFTSITDAFDWDMDTYEYDQNNDVFIQNDNCIDDCKYVLSYDNLAEKTEYGVEFFIMTRPQSWWDLKFGGDLSFGKMSSKANIENNIESDQNGKTSSTSLFANSSFTIKKDLKLDVNSWMWTTKLTDGKINPMIGTNLALRYDFLNKFSFVFKINDLFDSQKFNINTSEQYNIGAISYIANMDYERQRRGRTLAISFDYRFGDYKENKFKRGSHGHSHDGGDMMGY